MDQKTLEDLVKKYPNWLMPDPSLEGHWVMTCPVRAQFVWLINPRVDKDNSNKKPQYQLAGIIPAFADVEPLKLAARKAWADSSFSKTRGEPKKIPLKFQSLNEGKYEGFGKEGLYFDCGTINPITCFGAQAGPDGKLLTIPADAIKAGYWVRLKLEAYAYDKNGNWGVNFGLRGVQLIAEDDVFETKGGGNASDGFEPVNAPAGSGPAKMPGTSNGVASAW